MSKTSTVVVEETQDLSASVSKKTASTVSEIFESLSYGPAPESSMPAEGWLDDHGRAFGHFIDGKWVKPEGRKVYETKNPATGEKIASTTQGEKEDVDMAIAAARKAFKSWSRLSGHARARYLYSVARHVQKHMRLVAVVESMDNGKPIRESRDCDIPIVIRHLYHHAGWAELMDTEMKDWSPIGVVGAIVPWNFPLMLLCWKVCPALAMGNTVVLKPATYTRLSALLFAEICAEAGLPPGVFNVVTGSGSLGSHIVCHNDVDKIAFTGSTEVGQTLRRLTAGTGKKLSLELGGKSPFVVFDSADLDSTVEGVVDAIWFNQGQVCSAGSRLIVQESCSEQLIKKIKERMSHLRLGNSLDKCVDMGAIVDPSQKKSIDEFVQDAKNTGAEVFQSCASMPDTGCFYPPTLVTNVQPVSRIVQEEVFGPVLVVLTFRTAKEAIALANNTIYGLGSSVWSENIGLAMEVARYIRAGSVWINGHNLFDASAGFGGMRQSGFGRDGGKEGLYEYVKPSWQKRARPNVDDFDIKKFGSTSPPRPKDPTVNPPLCNGTDKNDNLPSIDHTYKNYIGGAQKRPDAHYGRPVHNEKGQTVGIVAESNRKDVRDAVEAAKKASAGWCKKSSHSRAQVLYYIAENMELRQQELALRICAMTGQNADEAEKEVKVAIQRVFHWAAYTDKYGGTVQETSWYGTTIKVHEAVGVVGIACPDEFPLLAFVSLVLPAISRGNTVVVLPSEKHPIVGADMYQIFDTSDLPGGVVNILTGDRDHVTKYIAEHQNVDAMWYFGSAEGSKFVESVSAENVKRTWVGYGESRDWLDNEQGQGQEFHYHAIECKNIWIPMGHVFAN